MLFTHRQIALTFFMFLFLFVISSAFAQEETNLKSSWYVGIGIGGGNGEWTESDGSKTTLDNYNKGKSNPFTFSMNFGIGMILSQKINIGYDLTIISNGADYSGDTYAVQCINYFLMITCFPMETGLFFRVGGGYSLLNYDTPTRNQEQNGGYGALLGLGYSLWYGDIVCIGLNFDYSYQKYSSKTDWPKDSRFYSLYISFYWF
jgi:hypothetical protein